MSTEQARAFWVTGPRRGEIRGETLAPPGPGEVLVRTLYTGISRGTESLVYNGQVPASEYQRMRAPFQTGDFPAPVKYGYINVGIVEHGPAELVGREVFCLYPHQTRYIVAADAVQPLPPKLPARRAVLTANMQTAVNGLWDADIKVGDRVAVIGAGTVGCLMAWLAARVGRGTALYGAPRPRRAPVDGARDPHAAANATMLPLDATPVARPTG